VGEQSGLTGGALMGELELAMTLRQSSSSADSSVLYSVAGARQLCRMVQRQCWSLATEVLAGGHHGMSVGIERVHGTYSDVSIKVG